MTKEAFAIIGIRLLSILLLAFAAIQLIANVMDSAWEFNPNYLGHYFATQLLRPLLALGSGILLAAFSGKIGRLIAKC